MLSYWKRQISMHIICIQNELPWGSKYSKVQNKEITQWGVLKTRGLGTIYEWRWNILECKVCVRRDWTFEMHFVFCDAPLLLYLIASVALEELQTNVKQRAKTRCSITQNPWAHWINPFVLSLSLSFLHSKIFQLWKYRTLWGWYCRLAPCTWNLSLAI